MNTEKIYDPERAAVCYFRTAAALPNQKILLQITERCNLRCSHCFVSSQASGGEMTYEQIEGLILPVFLDNNISKVTLTGGEPLFHPDVTKIIKLFCDNDISVSVCTNASLINEEFLDDVKNFKNVHFNVSLDGFSSESHGKFRGNNSTILYDKIISNIVNLSKSKLLNGILVTPNIYSSIEEYVKICEFAKSLGAKYVLFNPLSEFGRGQYSQNLGLAADTMRELQLATQYLNSQEFEVVYIRFPDNNKALGKCSLGRFLYVFVNGNLTVCPYIAFATKNEKSRYKASSFELGNLFDFSFRIEDALNKYQLPYEENNKPSDLECKTQNCSKGCIAAKIANGLSIYDCDIEMCL